MVDAEACGEEAALVVAAASAESAAAKATTSLLVAASPLDDGRAALFASTPAADPVDVALPSEATAAGEEDAGPSPPAASTFSSTPAAAGAAGAASPALCEAVASWSAETPARRDGTAGESAASEDAAAACAAAVPAALATAMSASLRAPRETAVSMLADRSSPGKPAGVAADDEDDDDDDEEEGDGMSHPGAGVAVTEEALLAALRAAKTHRLQVSLVSSKQVGAPQKMNPQSLHVCRQRVTPNALPHLAQYLEKHKQKWKSGKSERSTNEGPAQAEANERTRGGYLRALRREDPESGPLCVLGRLSPNRAFPGGD